MNRGSLLRLTLDRSATTPSLARTRPARIGWLDSRYGSWRGAARLALSYPETMLGLAAIKRPDPREVRRIVFVCQGNICRSAFAAAVARSRGLPVASFGLSTVTGMPASGWAKATARALGYDLSEHRTTAAEEFLLHDGDLLLAMEVRQLRRLAGHPRLSAAPRSMLGLWARPWIPHLHDPVDLDARYFLACFRRIERAVDRLAADYHTLRESPAPP